MSSTSRHSSSTILLIFSFNFSILTVELAVSLIMSFKSPIVITGILSENYNPIVKFITYLGPRAIGVM